MKNLFNRFIGVLITLILAMLLLFGINFYQVYRSDYNDILRETADRIQNNGRAINTKYENFMDFTRIILALKEVSEENFQELVEAYRIGNVSFVNFDESEGLVAAYGQRLSIFPHGDGGRIYAMESDGRYRYFISIPLFDSGGQYGYLVLDANPEPFEGAHLPYVLHVGNQVHLSSTGIVTEEQAGTIASLGWDEVITYLHDQGFNLFDYGTEEQFFQVVAFSPPGFFQRMALARVFNPSQVLQSVLLLVFMATAYAMYVFFIKPCYQVLLFVHSCNKGDYRIPGQPVAMWNPVFAGIREAYLHNERLRREAEEQAQRLEQAIKESQAANRAKTMFMAKVSHELKTPLNAIKGYAQLLNLKLTDEKQKKQAGVIDYSTGILMGMVNDLLDFSMLESGQLEIQHSAVSQPKAMEELRSLFAAQFEDKGIRFETITGRDVPGILYCDEKRINQVLYNLLSNALKFTDKGRVTFGIYAAPGGVGRMDITFRVEDTGKGIAADKLEQIFAPFNQEDNSISRHYGGTGLGLTISRQLVEQMGGELIVKSQPGVGSVFEFTIPMLNKEG
ncbi:MAG: HAMP domain-containing histidine kinase [Turicibacter sp.]|nr:HAMP domain-containing histidine kinase [Turicibacter sp.]